MNANETVTRASRDCLAMSDAQPLHPELWTHRVCRWRSSSVPEGDITYLAKLPASTYIKPIPALQIIRTIIPLCGFGHTEEWKWLPTSERRITRDGDPMHTPPLARIIVERAMLGAAVVPYRQRTNLPAESAGKLRLHGMRHQKIENRPRLGALEPFERLRVIAYVERFAAGLRMGPHKRMCGLRLQVAGVAHLGCHLLVAGVTAVSRRTYLVVPAQFLAVPDIP